MGQGRSGQVQKISPPPGLDLRTVQPVASSYTDYTTRAILSNRGLDYSLQQIRYVAVRTTGDKKLTSCSQNKGMYLFEKDATRP